MLMVIMMHVMWAGGALWGIPVQSKKGLIAWGLETFAYASVDTFAMLSGYVGYGGRHRVSSAVELYLTAIFFDVVVSIGVYKLGIVPDRALIMSSITRVFTGDCYWYLMCYLCLFPFMPLIDRGVASLDDQSGRKVCAFAILLFCIPLVLWGTDFGRTYKGGSTMWLAVLYLIGACFRRFGWYHKCSSGRLAFVALCAWGSALVWKLLLTPINGELSMRLISHISPCMVFIGIGLIGLLERLRVPDSLHGLVSFLSSSAFSVYVFHLTPALYDNVFPNLFSWLSGIRTILYPFACIACCLVIYFVCTCADKVRSLLFELCKVKQRLACFDRLGVQRVSDQTD